MSTIGGGNKGTMSSVGEEKLLAALHEISQGQLDLTRRLASVEAGMTLLSRQSLGGGGPGQSLGGGGPGRPRSPPSLRIGKLSC